MCAGNPFPQIKKHSSRLIPGMAPEFSLYWEELTHFCILACHQALTVAVPCVPSVLAWSFLLSVSAEFSLPTLGLGGAQTQTSDTSHMLPTSLFVSFSGMRAGSLPHRHMDLTSRDPHTSS